MPKELDKLVEIASMQRGPFTRQHAPDPTIKSVTKTKLQNLRSWSDQNRLVWHNFFAIYLHFLLNRAMGFLSETNVLARDALGQLLPAAKDFKKAFLCCYTTDTFKTGAERYMSGASHHMGNLLADFPRSMNDFWGEVNNFGGWDKWELAGGSELKTKNNIFCTPIWLQRAFETKQTNLTRPFNTKRRSVRNFTTSLL